MCSLLTFQLWCYVLFLSQEILKVAEDVKPPSSGFVAEVSLQSELASSNIPPYRLNSCVVTLIHLCPSTC